MPYKYNIDWVRDGKGKIREGLLELDDHTKIKLSFQSAGLGKSAISPTEIDLDKELEAISTTVDVTRQLWSSKDKDVKALRKRDDLSDDKNFDHLKDDLNLNIIFTKDPKDSGHGVASEGNAKVFWGPYSLKDREKIFKYEGGFESWPSDPIYTLAHELHHSFGHDNEYDKMSELAGLEAHQEAGNFYDSQGLQDRLQSLSYSIGSKDKLSSDEKHYTSYLYKQDPQALKEMLLRHDNIIDKNDDATLGWNSLKKWIGAKDKPAGTPVKKEEKPKVLLFRGVGKQGWEGMRPSEDGVLGAGVYFYTDGPESPIHGASLGARSYAGVGGGVLVAEVDPDKVQIHEPEDGYPHARVAVVQDPKDAKVILKIPTEDTDGPGKAFLKKITPLLEEKKPKAGWMMPQAKPPAAPPVEPPVKPMERHPRIKVKNDFEKLRSQFVIELDEATIKNMVKSYARGQAVATWEGGNEVDLGGPDAQEQVKYIIDQMQPIHEYNDGLATLLTKQLTEQVESGVEPGVMAQGMKGTITTFMRQPVEVPLKGPDGKPKLDKAGQPIVRTYSPEAYANLLSRTMTYSLRNRGYIDHYKKMGTGDGWESVCSADERSCQPCIDMDGKVFSWDDPQEPPSYHPFCRCRVKVHFSKNAEEGYAEDEQPEETPAAAPAPVDEQKIQAWQDWTVNQSWTDVSKLIEDQGIKVEVRPHNAGMSGLEAAYNEKNKAIWVDADLPAPAQLHAVVGTYAESLAKDMTPQEFLGCDSTVYQFLAPQREELFRNVNAARATGARVDLKAVDQKVAANWHEVLDSGRWKGQFSKPDDDPFKKEMAAEAELWSKIGKTSSSLDNIMQSQIKSVSFLSDPIEIGGQKVRVPLTQYRETMGKWLEEYNATVTNKKAKLDPQTFNDAVSLTMRSWYRNGSQDGWATPARFGAEAKMGSMLEGLHVDPGMVKDVAPDIYEYLTKQVNTGAYGEPMKKILTFTGKLEKNLPAEMRVLSDYDEIKDIIVNETGFNIKISNYNRSMEDARKTQAGSFDLKFKQFWLNREQGAATREGAAPNLVGQYANMLSHTLEPSPGMEKVSVNAELQNFFDWQPKEVQDGAVEIDQSLSKWFVKQQLGEDTDLAKEASDAIKDWDYICKSHTKKWIGRDFSEADSSEIKVKINEEMYKYMSQLKENGLDFSSFWDPEGKAKGMVKVLKDGEYKDQEINIKGIRYWMDGMFREAKLPKNLMDKKDDFISGISAKWFVQGRWTNYSGDGSLLMNEGQKLGKMMGILFKDEKFIKLNAPKAYDRFIEMNNRGRYGKGMQRIFLTDGMQTLGEILSKTSYSLKPMTNMDDMVKTVEQIFPVGKNIRPSDHALGLFHYMGDGNVDVDAKLWGTGQGRATLVHEAGGHGMDFLNSGKKGPLERPEDLSRVFPSLTPRQAVELYDTEMKDTMCQVRFSMSYEDVRLAERSVTRPNIYGETPDVLDYVGLRTQTLSEVNGMMKSGAYKVVTGPAKNLKELDDAMSSQIEKIRYKVIREGNHISRTAMWDDIVKIKDYDSAYLTRDGHAVTPYNLEGYINYAFNKIQCPSVTDQDKKDLASYVRLKWMQKIEADSNWSGDPAWSKRVSERWAVFVESCYVDPIRTKEIAPKAYAAFMDGMRTGAYNQMLGKLLGFAMQVA